MGGAISELERFLADRLALFEHDRAKMDRDSTSRLSPWIHIGSISVRYIFYRVRRRAGFVAEREAVLDGSGMCQRERGLLTGRGNRVTEKERAGRPVPASDCVSAEGCDVS